MSDITNLISDKTIRRPHNALDFTGLAEFNIQNLIRQDDFQYDDAALIFQYLQKQAQQTSFGDYLKRYIYRHMQIDRKFEEISDSDFRSILISAFLETETPKAFHETTTKLGVLAGSWLKAPAVSRETVFLLAFALKMTVEDTSLFLKKAIHEQDFNFKNPEEIVYWYCIRNGYSASKASAMIRDYVLSDSGPAPLHLEGGTLRNRKILMLASTEEDVISCLQGIKEQNPGRSYSSTAFNTFQNMIEAAKKAICEDRKEEELYVTGEKNEQLTIRESDIEHVLYSGVPVDQKGNLLRISLSSLKKQFAQYRLTRQRISKLSARQIPVTRYDLITLQFLLCSLREFDDPRSRYLAFAEETNRLLEYCYMGQLNISNLYEAFIIVCLLTEYPIGAFAEVWEISYQQKPK